MKSTACKHTILLVPLLLILMLQIGGCGATAIGRMAENARQEEIHRTSQCAAAIQGQDTQCDFELTAVTDSGAYSFMPYMSGIRTVDGTVYVHGSLAGSDGHAEQYLALPLTKVRSLHFDRCLKILTADAEMLSGTSDEWAADVEDGSVRSLTFSLRDRDSLCVFQLEDILSYQPCIENTNSDAVAAVQAGATIIEVVAIAGAAGVALILGLALSLR